MSVDPEHDSPDMLKAFADAFGADAPGWQFVTGQPADLNAINAKSGDRSAERRLSSNHNEILIGNDATGDWERDSAFDDIDPLVMTIRLMDPKWRGLAGAAQDRVASETGYYRLSDQPGPGGDRAGISDPRAAARCGRRRGQRRPCLGHSHHGPRRALRRACLGSMPPERLARRLKQLLE